MIVTQLYTFTKDHCTIHLQKNVNVNKESTVKNGEVDNALSLAFNLLILKLPAKTK